MEILGYEINIYYVMVVIAGIFVTTIILFISSHAGTKRRTLSRNKRTINKSKQVGVKSNPTAEKELLNRRAERSVQPQLVKPQLKSLAKETGQPAQLEEKPDEVFEKPEIQIGDKNEESLSEKTLEHTQSHSSNESADVATGLDRMPLPVSAKTAKIRAVDAASLLSEVDKVAEKVAAKNDEPDKKSEESEGSEKSGGLMDIFTDDVDEESDSKGLAALLTDVDLGTLNKLSEEMSQVLLKHRSSSKGEH